MHAVVIRVTVTDPERGQAELQDQVVPTVSQLPEFVSGYWTRVGNDGLSMVVFQSEDAARQLASRVPRIAPSSVTVNSVEEREVVAHA